jgi:predicted dehydrogenase
VAIAGRNEAAVAEAAKRYGYRTLLHRLARDGGRPDVQLLDNGGPNDLHAEPSILAAQAGQAHPLRKAAGPHAAEESKIMWDAVEKAGVKHMVAFNYRFVPAVRQIRYLIESGRFWRIYHFRAVYLQEWIMPHYNTPMIWRLHKDVAGSGALGDLGAHIIDLAHYLVGGVSSVSALTKTFIPERPMGRRDDGQGGCGRRLRCGGRIRERRHGHAGSDALRRRSQEFQTSSRSTARRAASASTWSA